MLTMGAHYMSDLSIPFFDKSSKKHPSGSRKRWSDFSKWATDRTPTLQDTKSLDIRYDVRNVLTKTKTRVDNRPIMKWFGDYLQSCRDNDYFVPKHIVFSEASKAQLKDCVDHAAELIEPDATYEKLEGTQFPKLFMDWQVQYVQTMTPLIALGAPNENSSGLAVAKYRGQQFLLDAKGRNFMSLLLLMALMKNTSKLIKSLKKSAKAAVKQCATAKNDLSIPGLPRNMHECIYPSSHEEGPNYWMPTGLDYLVNEVDESDDEDTKHCVVRPYHKFGHIIYEAYSNIIEDVSKRDTTTRKIGEVVRFLYQSRANTVATAEMKASSLEDWKKTLLASPEQTDPETLKWVEEEAALLAKEAVKEGFTLPKSISHLINTSGKLEASVKDGGSAEAIKRTFGERLQKSVFPNWDPVTLYSRQERPVNLGNALIQEIISEVADKFAIDPSDYADEPEPLETKGVDIMNFNAISVMEISKARTASIGSITLQTYLNVIAGIGLPAMKRIPESAGAATGGNLAFKFQKQMLNNESFVKDLKEGNASKWMIFSSDLSAATDSGRKDVALAALRGFFSNSIFDPVRGLINLGISIYCSSRNLEGAESFIGWLMGEPLTKLLLMIVNTIAWRRARKEVADKEGEGAFNGDDVFILCRSWRVIHAYLVNIAKLGLKTSWEDTFVSNVDHFYIYSEEVGLMPTDILTAPLVATETNRKDFACDILSFKRKLWVPYSKVRGWFADPRGRFSAMCIDHSYRYSNPGCALLMQLGLLIGGLTGDLRSTPACLPCVDTRKGGNAFPLPFPVTDETIRSSIIFQLEAGMMVAKDMIPRFKALALEQKDIPWREYTGKLPITYRDMNLTEHARSVAEELTEFPSITLTTSQKGEAEATLAHLLIRTGEYITTDNLFAKLRALSRLENTFEGIPILDAENLDYSTASSTAVSDDEFEELFDDEYIRCIRLQEDANSYSRTVGISTLVARSAIDSIIEDYKFRLPIMAKDEVDSGSEEQDMTPEQVAKLLLQSYEKNDWITILYCCRKYRTATDPILLSLAANFPVEIDQEIALVSMDKELQRRMEDSLRKGGRARSCRWLVREEKEELFIAGLYRAGLEKAKTKELRNTPTVDIMYDIVNIPTLQNIGRWLKGIADVLYENNATTLNGHGMIQKPDVFEGGSLYTFETTKLVIPDWGHIKALMWDARLRTDPNTNRLTLTWESHVTLSEDGRSTTTRSVTSRAGSR